MRISKAKFAAWLKAHPRRRFLVKDCFDCPLAKFTGCEIDPYEEPSRFPEWAQRFIERIDGLETLEDKLAFPPREVFVTSAKALRILQGSQLVDVGPKREAKPRTSHERTTNG